MPLVSYFSYLYFTAEDFKYIKAINIRVLLLDFM